MELSELRQSADAAKLLSGQWMTLVLPKRFKRPPKFPRGELLCENTDGNCVYRFDAGRMLKWVTWAESQVSTEEET